MNSSGVEGNSDSNNPVISGDGRYIAFQSDSSNLISGDTNGFFPLGIDIFVHDRQTGNTSRASVSSAGLQANSWSQNPSISYNGRYVTFTSPASNLVSGDTNGCADVFVHDQQIGKTVRASVSSLGIQGNGDSQNSMLSGDGRFVAFESRATNLVSGDTNNVWDLFVRDLVAAEQPTVTGITPSSAPNTAAHSVTITGINFVSGAVVNLTNSSVSIPGTVSSVNSTTIICSFILNGAPPWIYDMNIANPDGNTGTERNAFTVTNATPAITTITPSTGFNTGPLPVTITGTAFRNGATVTLVNNTTTILGSITNRTTTRILATFPLTGTTPGTYNLTVLNSDGLSGTKQNAFTVLSPGSDPTITGFTSILGVNTAALPITITGTNFRAGSVVTITNNMTSRTVTGTVTGTTIIKCSLPLTGLPIGQYNLTVKNTDGSSATRENEFTVTNPAPSISTIVPSSGYTTGPATVTISGSKFVSGAGMSLDNGTPGLPGVITSFSATKITGTFALHTLSPGTYNLTVTNPGGPNTTKYFVILSPGSDPTISGFTPISGVNTAALPITITGTNFRAGSAVTITNNTTSRTVTGTVTGTTTIKCSLPLTGLPIGEYNLTVKNTDGSSVTRGNEFTVTNPVPAISAITPGSGYTTGSATVTINGAKYVTGADISLVNGSTRITGSITSLSGSKIVGTFLLTGVTPGTYNLTVTNPGGPNATKPFTVLSPGTDPTISGCTPVSGVNTAALPITITGTNYRAGATVTITNGTTSKTVAGTLTGSTTIKCSLPLTGMPIGVYNLTVRNADGSSVTRENAFTVNNPVPVITAITPTSGYTTGSSTVTIVGSKFAPGAGIALVNGTNQIQGSITSLSGTKIVGTFGLPTVAPGLFNLTVINPGGWNATKPFTVLSPGTDPTITGFTPISGVNTAALPITITGTNYRAGPTVTITNNTTSRTVTGTVTGTTTIKCSLPLTELPIGQYNLTVKNTDGSSVTRENEFTVTNPAPSILTVAPSTGYTTGPATVTISGSKFVSGAGISLDNATSGLPGVVTSFSATRITGTLALHTLSPGMYNLTVTNPGGPNATKPFTVLSPGSDPTITGFTPTSGVNIAVFPITITGTNYRPGPTVTIMNGTTTKTVTGTVTGTTTIKCSLPLTGLPFGIYNLTVRNTDGSSVTRENEFMVTNPGPSISTIAPSSGYTTSPATVIISGSKFVSGAGISLENATSGLPGVIISFSATRITGTFALPTLSHGTYNLTVTNPGGPNATKPFTVLAPGTAPVISTINPASGFNNANLPVTITGVNFRTPSVYLNQGSLLKPAPATAGKTQTATTLYVTLPLAGVPGGLYTITVRNSDGMVVNATDVFYVTDQAWISSSPGTAGRSPVVQKAAIPSTGGMPSWGVNPIKRQVVRGERVSVPGINGQ